MHDNIIGIFNQLASSYEKYENHTPRANMEPHERMLDIIENDYMKFCNHDEWLAALKALVTAEEAELWCEYPEYTRTEVGITLDEVKAKIKPELAAKAEALTSNLVAQGLVYDVDGRYMTTYLLSLMFDIVQNYSASNPLHVAALKWWNHMSYDGNESKKFRATMSEHRILPHEGTLTGDNNYGRIPMGIDIPDTRQVLDIDRASEMLKRCHTFAVTECICRKTKDLGNMRECDAPLEVCLLFDEDAAGAIALGTGRQITYDDAMAIIRDCRDKGLVQIISNAEHPLAVCNCCECCCLCLLTLNRNEAAMAEVSRFIVDVAHSSDCVKCGACMRVCPAHAIDVQENFIQALSAKCIGCGLCVSKCPKSVLKMIPKPGAPTKLERDYIRRTYL